MSWEYLSDDPNLGLIKLHHFLVCRLQEGREIEFPVTVREYPEGSRKGPLRYFAQTDKQTNQKTAPYTPSGWGPTIDEALSACLKEIQRFPYEGE